MTVSSLAEKLDQLLEQGSLPSSRLTQRDRKRMGSLFETGILEEVRSGAGKKVAVKEVASLVKTAFC